MSVALQVGTALGPNMGESPTVRLQLGRLTGERLPALDRDIDVLRHQFDRVAGPARDLRRDDGGAGAAERLVDRLAGRRVVLDRALHALHRLLRAVLETFALARRDL